MSVPTTIQRYDPIYDAQRHFRALLDCTARPGTIGLLEDVGVDVPPGIRRASALIALTLFGADTTFCILPEPSPKTFGLLPGEYRRHRSAILGGRLPHPPGRWIGRWTSCPA